MLFKGNSSSLQLLIEKLQSSKEHTNTKDTLGTEGGSSWVSEDHTTSPGSSCATPNSTTEAPESELSFTIGVTDGTPHQCRFCDKAFSRHSYLKKHEQTHVECMPFRCEFCLRLFKHKRSRDRHIKLHTGDKKYKCTQCEAAFSRSDHLKIHMKTHDNQKPFQCTVCNRGYNTAAALTSHMQNHKRSNENAANQAPPGTTFKCLQCSEIFRKPEDLQNHMNTHQSSDGVSPLNGRTKSSSYSPMIRLTCTYCTKDNFSTMETLQTHVQSVHKSIVNGDLQRELSTNQQKSSPTNSLHSPSPLHPNQSFNSLPSYYCERCTMRFQSLQALQKHTTTVHGAGTFSQNTYNSLKYLELINNSKLYCMYCALHFLTPASLAEHFFMFHGYQAQLLGLTPIEQMKPTDLSVARRPSPIKRSIVDERVSPKKKYKFNENSNAAHRYDDYPAPLICNQFQCMAAFTDFESFRAHIKSHIEESGGLLGGATPAECKRPVEFTCPQCRSVFSSSEEISQHVVAHFLASSVAYSCETCHKAFDKANELHKHLMDVHAQHLYSCSICNEVFDSKVTIQVHFAAKHSSEAKVYRCTGCPSSNNVYHSELEFAAHVKSMHMSNSHLFSAFGTHHSTSTAKCSICHLTFPTDLEMQLHLATHGKQFQCKFCPQSFHIEYLLDKHMQTQHNPAMNGNHEQESGLKEVSPIRSPNSRFGSPVRKLENGDTKGNLLYCDICEKNEFANELELMAHKKLQHSKLISPGRASMESAESGDDHVKKHKTNSSTSSSPTLRYDGGKKMATTFNGDANPSNNNATSCEICEKRDFANEAELQSHKKLIHHNQNMKLSSSGKVSLHCAYCNENCKSRSDLENHMKSHSQNSTTSGKHKCIICDEMCPTAAVLAEHKLTHCKVVSGKTCMQCKGSITTEEQFYSHIQQHSSMNGTTTNKNNNNNNSSSQLILPTVCVICRQTLVSDMEARMHARFHLQQTGDLVPCAVCLQMCERQDMVAGICRECYQRHGDKSSPFRCPECHMKFDSDTAIEIHLATVHRKSFQCIKCQISFDNEKEIQHHVATHLMMDGLNGHECRLCRLVLPTSHLLQIHLIEHSYAGCATFTCYLCSSVFTTAHGLHSHVMEHGPAARPYDCSRCKQKFFFTSELEHHNYIHLEEMSLSEGPNYFYNQDKHDPTVLESAFKTKNYCCSECNIDFGHSSDYYEHKAHLHGQGERYVKNGDHKRRHAFNEVAKAEEASANEESKLPSVEVKVECKTQNDSESEDEQIDVVTTKTEDVSAQEREKTDQREEKQVI